MTEEQVKARRTLSRFALGLGILGGVLAVFGIYFLYTANKSLAWSSVEGKVVRTEVQTERIKGAASARKSTVTRYYVSVAYMYAVEGKPYYSSRYSIGGGDNASDYYSERSVAEKEAANLFPAGSKLTVYYDPDDPSSAVLAPGWNWGAFTPLLLGIFFGGAGWFFYYVVKKADVSTERNTL